MEFLQLTCAYNSWANQQLLDFCLQQDEKILDAPGPTGTYGSIRGTFTHLIGAEERYLHRLGVDLSNPISSETDPLMSELPAHLTAVATAWQTLLATNIDLSKQVVTKTGTTTAGIVLAQTIHHGSDHRSHINTVLTVNGVTPPDLDVWAYAVATGLFNEAEPAIPS